MQFKHRFRCDLVDPLHGMMVQVCSIPGCQMLAACRVQPHAEKLMVGQSSNIYGQFSGNVLYGVAQHLVARYGPWGTDDAKVLINSVLPKSKTLFLTLTEPQTTMNLTLLGCVRFI